MKPIRISEHLTITMDGEKALVVSRYGIAPAEVKRQIDDWFVKNSPHQRGPDVYSWLGVYEEQNPAAPKTEEISQEKMKRLESTFRIRNRLVRMAMKHFGISMEAAREKVNAWLVAE